MNETEKELSTPALNSEPTFNGQTKEYGYKRWLINNMYNHDKDRPYEQLTNKLFEIQKEILTIFNHRINNGTIKDIYTTYNWQRSLANLVGIGEWSSFSDIYQRVNIIKRTFDRNFTLIKNDNGSITITKT